MELPKIEKPVDCIFIIYSKEILDMDFKVIQKTIRDLLKEANIL